MVRKLQRRGGIVETAKSGVDFSAGNYAGISDKLARADVLVLAHGAKTEDCWNANYVTFTGLIDLFIESARPAWPRPRSGPWARRSNSMAIWAWTNSRPIPPPSGPSPPAPANITAAMPCSIGTRPLLLHLGHGQGRDERQTAVAIALFFIRRGFSYVPITLTGMALLNYFRFRYFQKGEPEALPAAE